jgi:hypothetical protein
VAACTRCGTETDLYFGDSPICVACADDQDRAAEKIRPAQKEIKRDQPLPKGAASDETMPSAFSSCAEIKSVLNIGVDEYTELLLFAILLSYLLSGRSPILMRLLFFLLATTQFPKIAPNAPGGGA